MARRGTKLVPRRDKFGGVQHELTGTRTRVGERQPDEAWTLPESFQAQTAGRRRKRTDWRNGGRAVNKWNGGVLLASLGAAFVGAALSLTIARYGGAALPAWSTPVLWAGLLAGPIYAFLRARPAGLFRLKGQDLLWGVALAGALRLLQGGLSGANDLPFPTALSLGRFETDPVWFVQPLLFGVGGSIVEEVFFRGVLLVVVFQLFRRSTGYIAAITTAVLVSAGTFVILHAAFNRLSLSDGLQLFFLGTVCSLLVILTGRFWPALFTHAAYNLSFLLLILSGESFRI
jgi:membrane protease YdiL (CAAX protease family)